MISLPNRYREGELAAALRSDGPTHIGALLVLVLRRHGIYATQEALQSPPPASRQLPLPFEPESDVTR